MPAKDRRSVPHNQLFSHAAMQIVPLEICRYPYGSCDQNMSWSMLKAACVTVTSSDGVYYRFIYIRRPHDGVISQFTQAICCGLTNEEKLKPGPHQQQCRSNKQLCCLLLRQYCRFGQQCRINVRLCRKDEISTQNSFDIVAVFGNKVERCFDIVKGKR